MIDFSNIEKYKENNRIEAKKAIGGLPRSIWETYSAFANTLGGIILLGVEEHADKSLHPVDLPDPEKLIKDFWDIVNNANKVSANILSDKDVTIENIDGKRIVAIRVPRAQRSDKPVYIDGNPLSGSYRRNGEGDYKCTKEEVQAMMRDAAIKTQDMLVLENMELDAFDYDTGEPESILLKDLAKEYYRLEFLVEEKSELLHREEQISIQAGELVGKLYDAILKQYIHPDDKASLHSLNILCVRLVFCLYAEDSGIFGEHLKFHNYIKSFAPKDVRKALIELFRVLDTKTEDRDPYMDDVLASFPYVNGGLFADENIEIPNFTQEIVDLLLHKASEDFDWSQISPTIFGAVFESTLNPETRRSGGMHYTSIENIHKVIDPLFLDELREEFDEIKALKVPKIRNDKSEAFREKLSKLTFFDPACGSGRQVSRGIKQIPINDLSLVYVAQFLCNIKHSTWSYEKEFRCTAGAQAKGMPYIDAVPKAIYIGMNCTEQNRSKLIEIARSLSIPVYQMQLDELSEKYCLEEVLLKS